MKPLKTIYPRLMLVGSALLGISSLFLLRMLSEKQEHILLIIVLLITFFLLLAMAGITYFAYHSIIKAQQDVWEMAYVDPLTKASNFSKFKIDAARLFQEYPTQKYAVFYSDIKNFKYLNDVYGFEVGNKVLCRYSDLLCDSGKLLYARINADNFVSIESYTDETILEQECLQRIREFGDLSGIVEGNLSITIFVGVYCTKGDNLSMSIDDMIDRANLAQKQLKNKQAAGCVMYSEKFRKSMLIEQGMELRMHTALQNGEFLVFLQPKFDITLGKIAAAEALVRWKDPKVGLISPAQFIPLFERNGFIQQLDTFMFEQVCKLIRKWLDMGIQVFPLSVNVSKSQLSNPTFMEDYIHIKEKYNIPDGNIEIEFTESMLLDNNDKMIEVLRFFRSHGFLSSIDDFGSGYSSLNVLKNLPVDILKLDKVFFDKNEYQDREKVIIKSVISMAKELSMQTVAEGVEEWEQVEFLQSVKCELVQGYVFDRPMPVDEFEQKYIYNSFQSEMVLAHYS